LSTLLALCMLFFGFCQWPLPGQAHLPESSLSM